MGRTAGWLDWDWWDFVTNLLDEGSKYVLQKKVKWALVPLTVINLNCVLTHSVRVTMFGKVSGFAPCKRIQVSESGKFFIVEFGIFSFGIRNTAQGIQIPLKIRIRNPSSTDKDRNPVPGIRNPTRAAVGRMLGRSGSAGHRKGGNEISNFKSLPFCSYQPSCFS